MKCARPSSNTHSIIVPFVTSTVQCAIPFVFSILPLRTKSLLPFGFYLVVCTQWNWFSNCASQSPLAYIRNIVMLWKLRPKLGKRGSGIVEHSKPCFTNLRRWGSYEASDIPVSHIEGIVWTHSDSWRCVWRGSLRDIKVTEIFIGS